MDGRFASSCRNGAASVFEPERFNPESQANDDSANQSGGLPLQDLTALARLGGITRAVTLGPSLDSEPHRRSAASRTKDPYGHLTRVLCRRFGFHVFLVGDRGVGKTTVVRELARRAALGELPRLEDRRFVRVDCARLPADDGQAVLEAVFAFSDAPARLVLCLDRVAALLRRCDGRTNVAAFLAGLRRSQVPVISLLSRWEYDDLLAGHADVRELAAKIEIEEPPEPTLLAILMQHAARLAGEFRVSIPEPLLKRTAALTSSYLLSEHQPAKSIRVLELACENAAFDRSEKNAVSADIDPSDRSAQKDVMLHDCGLQDSDLLNVVAEITGIAPETLGGEVADDDFEAALRAAVVGQEASVAAVANELRLIRSGLVDPGKPASVLLFAGLTGVGKTELAKTVARLYSGSGRLNVYSMGNFTEPHSVSGIIGVPPGYVGYEHGGRLINELNADPHAVFLLDEAEKAHPNIWKPFLTLFDEGWIEDARGVRACADRAIFILTTNAGSDHIARMTETGSTETEIEERVKSALARVKLERSTQPVFTPQFLARITRILVFRPLDETAMIDVARKLAGQVQKRWQEKREQQLEIDGRLIEWIGRRAHALNQKSGNKEGGRIILRLIRDHIETRAHQELAQQPDAGRHDREVHVDFSTLPEA